MKIRKLLMVGGCAALMAAVTGSVLAQNNAAPPPGNRAGGAAPPGGRGFAPRSTLKHRLYVALPGDNGADGQSGILVLDADHDYRFVARIPYGLPASKLPGSKISGMTASVPENRIYVTTDDGQMMAFDLGTDKMVWDFKGEKNAAKSTRRGAAADGCCERPWTMPGGKALMVASGYNSWWWFIDAHSGKILGKIDTPQAPNAHNLTLTADGTFGALASLSGGENANVAIVNIAHNGNSYSGKVKCYIHFSDSPRPLTMNADGSLIYVNVNNLDGFEIGDTKTCKMIKRVELPGNLWKAKWADPNHRFFGHGLPSHGIGMTPDGKEIWVTDAANSSWQIWDNPGDGRNPVYNPAKTVKVEDGSVSGGSSWITMTNDGKLAFAGDGSIIDVRAHKMIGQMKDEYGHLVHATEKVMYGTFDDGKLLEATNQFAIGGAKPADKPADKAVPEKQARN